MWDPRLASPAEDQLRLRLGWHVIQVAATGELPWNYDYGTAGSDINAVVASMALGVVVGRMITLVFRQALDSVEGGSRGGASSRLNSEKPNAHPALQYVFQRWS